MTVPIRAAGGTPAAATENTNYIVASLIARRWLPAATVLGLALGAGAAQAATINVDARAVDDMVNGNCSLVEAIRAANTDAAVDACVAGNGDDTIILPANSTFTLDAVNNATSYYGATSLPFVTSNITIEGNGSTIKRSTASGTPDFRLFAVYGSDLTLRDTTLSGGSISGYGGAIYNSGGNLTLEGSKVTGNKATYGGGIGSHNHYGSLTLTHSTVSGNSASRAGGGIYAYHTLSVALTDSTVSGNTVSGTTGDVRGGGIFSVGLGGSISPTLTLTDSTVSGNRVLTTDGNAYGGGIYNGRYSTTNLTRSTVSGNSASVKSSNNYGYGYYGYNSAGAGIANHDHATLNLTHSTVSGNKAISDSKSHSLGGGIRNFDHATLSLTGSTVSGNSAEDSGGGIHSGANSTMDILSSTVSGNSAVLGGGILNTDNATLTNSTVSGNKASNGGGIRNWGTLSLTHVTLAGNVARSYGGGLYNEGSTTLSNTLVSGNQAPDGAEVYNYYGTINVSNFNLFGHSGLTNAKAFVGFTPSGSDIVATSDGTQSTALGKILQASGSTPKLADNGGPTQTIALVQDSPAIDAGNSGETDSQRGSDRPFGAAVDIGAYEADANPPKSSAGGGGGGGGGGSLGFSLLGLLGLGFLRRKRTR